jgi:DNA-binding Lrp family transcriptional regulator
MFGFVERFIVAKILEITRNHWLGDQVALEALVRFCDEELKHEELFRRMERMIDRGMPPGYAFPWDPNAVAGAVLSKSTWAVLGLIYQIELFTQTHYKESIEPDDNLSDLYNDVFLFHWQEEVTHALMDELEWPLEDRKLTPAEREQAVTELIELVGDVDGILLSQSAADVDYFFRHCGRSLTKEERQKILTGVLQAYRWQYIFSGTSHRRFIALLNTLTTEEQRQRLGEALKKIQ